MTEDVHWGRGTMIDLNNKNAVITGGTRGIGRAISLGLAECGANVYSIYARNRQSAEALESEALDHGFKIIAIRSDLTHEDSFNELVKRIKESCKTIDILVHSAASGVHRDVKDITDHHLRWTFEINFFAIHKLFHEFINLIPRGGRIIGITSAGGQKVIPYYSAIGASKGALESLFRHYARELAPSGINVNLICPGLVITEALKAFPDFEQRIKDTLEKTPTSELTTPEQVASLVKFLCSKEASQIVGQTIVIDGGKSLLS